MTAQEISSAISLASSTKSTEFDKKNESEVMVMTHKGTVFFRC